MNTITQHDPAKRLPDVAEGTPPNAKVRIDLRIVRTTERAFQVEQLDHPNGRAWLPRSIVGVPTPVGFQGGKFHMPLWLFREIRQRI